MDDLGLLKRLQDDLAEIFLRSNIHYTYRIDHTGSPNAADPLGQRGGAVAPPVDRIRDRFMGLSDVQEQALREAMDVRERMEMSKQIRMAQEELKAEMPEIFKMEEDFIEEDEMKL
jgi:hypothetical protein